MPKRQKRTRAADGAGKARDDEDDGSLVQMYVVALGGALLLSVAAGMCVYVFL
ncbi:UNVERIFIED_ORG: hypothetical protein M2414_005428 [Rahnella aquatilis]